MKEKLKKIFKIIFSNNFETEDSKKNDILIKGICCLLLTICSFALTIINIVTKKWIMMGTTLFLTMAFSISALLLLKFKQRRVSEVVLSIVICVVFTFYALWGENDGFAVLWIILCPPICTLFFNFKLGIGVSIYFFLVIIVLFICPIMFPALKDVIPAYTNHVPGYYAQFQYRFPLLYLSSFTISIFLNAQKIYYSRIAERNSVTDAMTLLRNRRYFNDYCLKFNNKTVDNVFSIISLDINNLKMINDKYSHNSGDIAIIKTAETLREVFGDYTNNIYRTGGDEFFIFFNDHLNEGEKLIEKFTKKIGEVKIQNMALSVSCGYIKGINYLGKTFNELLAITETKMYEDKQKYYDKHLVEKRRTYSTK